LKRRPRFGVTNPETGANARGSAAEERSQPPAIANSRIRENFGLPEHLF
jgi:hypothetical protein